jgi:hypothetical protein
MAALMLAAYTTMIVSALINAGATEKRIFEDANIIML